jgi:hypothetical protein
MQLRNLIAQQNDKFKYFEQYKEYIAGEIETTVQKLISTKVAALN